jgi:hypothetical protein
MDFGDLALADVLVSDEIKDVHFATVIRVIE